MVAVLAFAASTAAAASANLVTGGFGQRASDLSTFGVAVCNNGTAPLTQSVPVLGRCKRPHGHGKVCGPDRHRRLLVCVFALPLVQYDRRAYLFRERYRFERHTEI